MDITTQYHPQQANEWSNCEKTSMDAEVKCCINTATPFLCLLN